MRMLTRLGAGTLLAVGAVSMSVAPALAHECTNISKPADAGVQIVFNDADEIVWVSKGLQSRIDNGIVDPETGEGFSGLIGFDVDGDGKADVSTYIVGPYGEIPEKAQLNGSPCHGIVNIGVLFTPVSEGGCAVDPV
jgi:hypothetical protein